MASLNPWGEPTIRKDLMSGVSPVSSVHQFGDGFVSKPAPVSLHDKPPLKPGATVFGGGVQDGYTVIPADPTRMGIGGVLHDFVYGASENRLVPTDIYQAGGGIEYSEITGVQVPHRRWNPATGWTYYTDEEKSLFYQEGLGVDLAATAIAGAESTTNITGAGDHTTYEAGAIQSGGNIYEGSSYVSNYDIDNTTTYEAGAIVTTQTTSIGGATNVYNIQNEAAAASSQYSPYNEYSQYPEYDEEEETYGSFFDPATGVWYS